MKIEYIETDIKNIIETRINPSESSEKVLQAIKNITGNAELRIIKKNSQHLRFETKDLMSLSTIYEKIRSRQIVSGVRRILVQNILGNSTFILLNKQAAFIGSINICEEEKDSNLGSIKLIIESHDINKIIDWLAPHINRSFKKICNIL